MQITSLVVWILSIFFIIVLYFIQKVMKTSYIKIHFIILLVFSYFLIGILDKNYAIILFITTCAYFFLGKAIERYRKKIIIILSVSLTLISLFVFKYINFFGELYYSFLNKDWNLINIILPLGISFYLFSGLSYIFDVYNGKIRAEHSFLTFTLYLSFYPKFLCGPIVRFHDFKEQIKKYEGIQYENFTVGIQIFVFGLFKKIVLADHLGVFVDDVYFSPSAFHSITILLAVISYAIQIYFDFSGYSDMAIGLSRIFGFKFSKNFDLPYLSRNIAEFWKRWHISLSSWFQDYLYIPLGGNRKGEIRSYVNTMIVMICSGLWHGSNITFLFWGFLHGVILCIYKIYKKLFNKKSSSFHLTSCILTFVIVALLWIPFRATNLHNMYQIFKALIIPQSGIIQMYSWSFISILILLVCSIITMVKQKSANKIEGFYPILNLNTIIGQTIFFVFIGITILFAYVGNTAFIYGGF